MLIYFSPARRWLSGHRTPVPEGALTIDVDSYQSINWYSTARAAAWVRFEAPSFLMQALT